MSYAHNKRKKLRRRLRKRHGKAWETVYYNIVKEILRKRAGPAVRLSELMVSQEGKSE